MSSSHITQDGIDLSALLQAYQQFHDALQVAKSDLEKAGVIQYFEFTYELAWKSLRRILKARGKDLNSPKPVFREAAVEGLIDSPERWFSFLESRNETVHTYNRRIADQIFSDLTLFDSEMQKLIQVLVRL